VRSPLSTVKNRIHNELGEKASVGWYSIANCKRTRQTWPTYNPKRPLEFLSKTSKAIATLTAAITVLWHIGTHARKLGLQHAITAEKGGRVPSFIKAATTLRDWFA